MILKCSKDECRWRRRKDARPEEILDAALALFTEKGFNSTRMIDIARKAGISKGTLYLYFDSKQLVFEELVKTILSPMVDEAENAISQFKGSSTELIQQFVTGWWNHIWNSKLSGIPKLIFSEAGNFPEMATFYTETIVKRVRGLFQKAIQQGIDNQEFIECDAGTASRLLMAPIIQAAIWKHSLKPYDDELNEQQYIEQHLQIFLNGLKKGNKNAN